MDSDHHRNIDFRHIADNFSSLDQVISALRHEGLESSNLILGIDFTKSNEWTGRHSFRRRSLHSIGSIPNPYEQAISIIGQTLSPFDDDGLIPCLGFGDGPTSFAPVIDAAIGIVEKTNWQYHVLVIVADGQVTRNPDTPPGRLSSQEQATINSIVAASHYPLSIVLVGVGDGPWDAMRQFDDNIPQRAFDNFQFVNFTKIMSESKEESKKEAAFALAALMEIPFQYRATLSLQYSKRESVYSKSAGPVPPPPEVINHDNAVANQNLIKANAERQSSSSESVCPICQTNPKDMAFACGHTTCKDCGVTISTCPLCREPIKMRVRLY
ncbi:E3 ubiquitin-protein ligase RGLG3-like isoform X2 [Cucurbita maxima]|uniref:E3 ubiquitin-protein ligase RGLG3-like isoform X2 n=1 Tax=Cucurbita maxima TaxID=3661 RepID=A0A6J1KVY2_CUCMA|nr:E3 ubiquitin-protein ligase RGLG3-like isoform X2 [Cucurbita maxima]